jgi:hypothetical protein
MMINKNNDKIDNNEEGKGEKKSLDEEHSRPGMDHKLTLHITQLPASASAPA